MYSANRVGYLNECFWNWTAYFVCENIYIDGYKIPTVFTHSCIQVIRTCNNYTVTLFGLEFQCILKLAGSILFQQKAIINIYTRITIKN